MNLNKCELDRMARNMSAFCPACGSSTERISNYDSFGMYYAWTRTWTCRNSCGAIVTCHVELKPGQHLGNARTVKVKVTTRDTS